MADDLKAPVAIRITRPYDTEAQFLEREFDTLTRTSVILLGAQPRPQGVILRFEIVLKSGASILRGEGRVVGYKERAYGGDPGLTLRFTRLDSKSKILVDKAAALREARVRASTSLMGMPAVVVPKVGESAPSLQTGETPIAMMATGEIPIGSSIPEPSPPPAVAVTRASSSPPRRSTPPPLPEWARKPSPPPPPPSESELEITHVDPLPFAPPPTPKPAAKPAPPPPPPAPKRAPAPPAAPSPIAARPPRTDGARAVTPPADRDALLGRLRTRARAMSPDAIRELLAQRRA